MEKRNEATVESATHTPLYFTSPGEAVARYTHCNVCGGNLHFSHLTDFVRNITQETARCPECGVKVRRVVHRLQ